MAFEPGSRLGRYKILAALDTANAEEAYKASDTERNRTVTIKILPKDISESAASSQRLENAVRAVASLNHPNISAVYEVGRDQETGYIVTEYLEGTTLAERLARGPLDLEEALKIAIAMADALDKAHRQGVAHRSLSPSRVMLTPSGVKMFDFGLADAPVASGPPISASVASTRTAPALAMALPTSLMPYQSPEQLDGKEADARCDLFAFGSILYEMIAGKPAFEGRTQALLIAAIQTIDPEPFSKTQPVAPAALDFIVRRCLAKDPKKRLHSAFDLLCQLRWIAGGGSQTGVVVSQRKKMDRFFRIALLAALAVAVLLMPAAYLYYRGAPGELKARYIVSNIGFTALGGRAGGTAYLSPNGRWLLASRGGTNGMDAIALNSVTKRTLLVGHAVYYAFWKPDNEEFAFFEQGRLKRASLTGGDPRNIVDVPEPFGAGSWSSSGEIIFSSKGLLYRVLDVGGEAKAITALDQSLQETEHLAPVFLPDGRHYLFLAVSSKPENSAIYVGSLDSMERTRLVASNSRPHYAAPGYLLFNRRDAVYAQAFDADKLALKGEPLLVADGVPAVQTVANSPTSEGLWDSAAFSTSQTGMLSYRVGIPGQFGRGGAAGPRGGSSPDLSLVWINRSGQIAPVGAPGAYAGLNVAPDGKRFAVHRHEGDGGDIWVYDPEQGSQLRRWTFDVSQENASPVWSPDGKRIAFASHRNGKWGIYVKAADNTGNEDRVVELNMPLAPMSWPATDQIVYWAEDPKTRGDIWAVSMSGDRKPVPILQTEAEETYPQVSPDGKWIAYMSPDAMGTTQIWVNSFPKAQGSGWQVTNQVGRLPRWQADGKDLRLFYYAPPNIMSVALRVVGAAIQASDPQTILATNNPNLLNSSHYSPNFSYQRFAVSPDGQQFLIPQPAGSPTSRGTRGGAAPFADALAATIDSNTGMSTTNEIAIVLDWPRMLKPK
jgi:Tol biopolymer transport system component